MQIVINLYDQLAFILAFHLHYFLIEEKTSLIIFQSHINSSSLKLNLFIVVFSSYFQPINYPSMLVYSGGC